MVVEEPAAPLGPAPSPSPGPAACPHCVRSLCASRPPAPLPASAPCAALGGAPAGCWSLGDTQKFFLGGGTPIPRAASGQPPVGRRGGVGRTPALCLRGSGLRRGRKALSGPFLGFGGNEVLPLMHAKTAWRFWFYTGVLLNRCLLGNHL